MLFHKITINLLNLLTSLLILTLNKKTDQSQGHTGALEMPLSASQSLNREALVALVLHGFQNSGSLHHLVLVDSPNDGMYKCMLILLLQTYNSQLC